MAFLRTQHHWWLGLLLLLAGCATPRADPDRARYVLGYTDTRGDDPRGQFYNWRTQRAMVIHADGSGRRELGAAAITEENTWTYLVGWWPDGRAVIGVAWENPGNYAWERAHQAFRTTEGNWRLDCGLLDLGTGRLANLTAVEPVSNYNPGLAPWPGDPGRATFAPLINGIQHPFAMDADGRNKRDLSRGPEGFTYACSVSPDGQHIAYNKNYQVFIAEKDGANPRRLDENPAHPFQFIPTWSPDGQWLLFLAGEHYHNQLQLVRADGTGLRQLADRGGYRGTFEPLQHPDFHSSGSDLPVWSPDARWVYYTAKIGAAVELMRVSVAGQVEQLTHSPPGTENYYPEVSPDGRLVAFGRRWHGAAALCVADADGRTARLITAPTPDRVQTYPHWQPLPATASAGSKGP